MTGLLWASKQLLDLGDGLGVVLVADRVDACGTRAGYACVDVIEKDHLPGGTFRRVQMSA
jgi:hypothetical protein